MSSGTDTNSSATNANSPSANADSSSYREASVVSGLAASVAAQLYSFFNDPQSYTQLMADDQEPLASCREGKCLQYYYIASQCYTAVAVNLAAAVTAFILIDWKAKQAAKSRFVSDYMVNLGHLMWFFAFYFGILAVVIPVVRYALVEEKIVKKWSLFLHLSPPALLFVVYIGMELANLASQLRTMWRSGRGTPASSSSDTSPKEGASVNASV